MKKVMCVIFAVVSLMLVSAIYADQSVLIKTPKVADPVVVETDVVVGWAIAPIVVGHKVYKAHPVPPTPLVVIPPPVKPIFKTPIRDGAYYGTYYSRVYRFNRMARLLNVQPLPPPTQTIPQPVPTQPTTPNTPTPAQPVTPNDP